MSRQWFKMAAKGDEKSEAELYIYGDIGRSYWDDDAVSAKDFIAALKALPESVMKACLHVNSLGGDVFDAAAIANALRHWARAKEGRVIETTVDGIAASAASVVIMAGDTVRIGDNAMVMVHNPWTWGVGNAAEMRKLAEALDKIRDTIVAAYKWHSKLDDAALIALMDAETWMSADEAIANGFATEKVEGLKAAASLNRRVNPNLTIPEKFRARVNELLEPEPAAPPAASAEDVLAMCEEAGLGVAFAKTVIAAKATVDQAKAKVEGEKTVRAAAKARETQITTLCAGAKLPELAAKLVGSQMSIDDVKATLTLLTAKLDRVEIDGGLDPDTNTPKAAAVNVVQIYAARNGGDSFTSKEK